MEATTHRAMAIKAIYERLPAATAGLGVATSRHAVGRTQEAAERAEAAATRALRDTTKTEAGRAVAAYKAARLAAGSALNENNSARELIGREMNEVETKLERLTRPTDWEQSMLPLVLGHINGLKNSEAISILQEAQDKGDLLTQRAILSVPDYLTTMPPDWLGQYRESFYMSQDPESFEYRALLDDSLRAVNAADTVLASIVKDYDTPEVRRLIEAAEEAGA